MSLTHCGVEGAGCCVIALTQRRRANSKEDARWRNQPRGREATCGQVSYLGGLFRYEGRASGGVCQALRHEEQKRVSLLRRL